jgi:hypothetical protein
MESIDQCVLHNAAKKAANKMAVDAEVFVVKSVYRRTGFISAYL